MILRKSFKGVVLLVSILWILGLVLGLISQEVSPVKWVIPAFFGLSFPIIFILNLLFLGLSWFYSKRVFLIQVLVCGLSISPMSHFFNITTGNKEKPEKKIRIVTFNVRGFNRYNWIEDSGIQGKIEEVLLKQNPDIICFQEFHLPGKDDRKAIKNFSKKIGLSYYAFNNYKSNDHISGLVIFSKYPLKPVYRENFHAEVYGGNGVLVCDLKVKDDSLRVVNMHLESIRFERPDYDYAVNPGAKNGEFRTGGVRILQRFSRAYRLRALQVESIVEEIGKSHLPVVLAGDANDTPVSYTYSSLTKGLRDTFKSGKIGVGSTYAGPLPSFRIDYIMYSKELVALNYDVVNSERLSDHYPVVSDLSW